MLLLLLLLQILLVLPSLYLSPRTTSHSHRRPLCFTADRLSSICPPGPCVVVGSDARVRIVETDRATYPDLMIVCGPRHAASDDRHGTVNPKVIVEVLSDSTERDDRGEKFAHYRQISSLREYVLVAQKEARVEVFTREAGDSAVWRFSEAVGEGIVRFASVDVVVPLDEVYRGVAFAAAPADG